jgi:hypothetical protein
MRLLGEDLVVNTKMFVGSHVAFGIPRMIPRIAPLESHEEGAQQGCVGPRCVGEDGAPWCLADDEALQLHLEGYCHISNPIGESRRQY